MDVSVSAFVFKRDGALEIFPSLKDKLWMALCLNVRLGRYFPEGPQVFGGANVKSVVENSGRGADRFGEIGPEKEFGFVAGLEREDFAFLGGEIDPAAGGDRGSEVIACGSEAFFVQKKLPGRGIVDG